MPTNIRTIKELLPEVGILEGEAPSFREDVLAFLQERSGGQQQQMFDLHAAQIQILSRRFIDSSKGHYWFTRRGVAKEWAHGTTREQVTNALPDLCRRWIKNKKESAQKNDVQHMIGNPKPKASLWRPNTLSRNGTIPSYLQPQSPDVTKEKKDRSSPTISDNEDDGTLPDIPARHNSDLASLPDIAEIFTEKRGPVRARSPTDWSPDTSQAPPPPASPGAVEDVGIGIAIPDTHAQSPRTPARTMATGLPSPPVTSPKRKRSEFLDVDAMGDDNENENPRECEVAKKARICIQDPTLGTDAEQSRTPSRSGPPILQEEVTMALLPAVGSETDEAHDAEPLADTDPSPTELIPLSLFNSLAGQVTLSHDALLNMPATMLDYIRRCEKSSLTKANRNDLNQADRQRHRDRCRLLRDLLTDLESRILSMSHDTTKKEDGANPEEYSQDSSQVEVSSYVLWNWI